MQFQFHLLENDGTVHNTSKPISVLLLWGTNAEVECQVNMPSTCTNDSVLIPPGKHVNLASMYYLICHGHLLCICTQRLAWWFRVRQGETDVAHTVP